MGLVHNPNLDLIVLGPSLADPDVLPVLASEIRKRVKDVPLLLIATNSSEDLAICALRAGVNEYVAVSSPDELARAIPVGLSRDLRPRVRYRGPAIAANVASGLIGGSASMRELKCRLNRIAASDSIVLVTGETGTGKELVAEWLHLAGSRRDKPFITINCAAIPDSLLESELFGYERGAFTGAEGASSGRLNS